MNVLPGGWRWQPLADVVRGGLFVDGDWVETKDQDAGGSVRLTQLADVGVGQFRDRSDRWMREDQAARLGCTFLNPDDVLVARMPDPIGRACLAPNGIGRAVTAVDVAILRPPRTAIDRRYLMWAINSPDVHQRIEALQSGTTRKRVSRKNLATVAIPVAPLHQQGRIVDLLEDHLSHLNAAEESIRTAHQRLATWRASILDSVVDDNGDRCRLEDLLDRVEAGRSFGGSAAPAAPDAWGIIKVSAMTWGEFRPDENKAIPSERADPRYEIRRGDILVSRANTSAYVGASVVVGETRPRLLLSDKSLRLVPKPAVDPSWLHLVLSAPGARQQISDRATGTKDSMRNISQAALLGIDVPDREPEEQLAAVARCSELLSAASRLAAETDAAQRRLSSLRRAVLAAAFAGRLTGGSSDIEVIEEASA